MMEKRLAAPLVSPMADAAQEMCNCSSDWLCAEFISSRARASAVPCLPIPVEWVSMRDRSENSVSAFFKLLLKESKYRRERSVDSDFWDLPDLWVPLFCISPGI